VIDRASLKDGRIAKIAKFAKHPEPPQNWKNSQNSQSPLKAGKKLRRSCVSRLHRR
jgi:hypothetical protein